jgi:hypothetical protein
MGENIVIDPNSYITFKGKRYAFDLDAIKNACLISGDQNGKETEVTEAYETDDDNNLSLSSKIVRDIKSTGNPQNDMIIYDVVKLFIIRLIDNTQIEREFDMDFSTALAINTLLKWGMLIEL